MNNASLKRRLMKRYGYNNCKIKNNRFVIPKVNSYTELDFIDHYFIRERIEKRKHIDLLNMESFSRSDRVNSLGLYFFINYLLI